MDVSVIVPLYNNERYITAALDSALNQGVRNIEIIVVNDGSTDAGPDVVSSYSKEHHEVRLINQPNQGVSSARNNGLDHATGTFVAFLDSDDAYRPGALGDMLTIAQERSADLVIGETRNVGAFKTNSQLRTRRLSEESLIDRESLDLVYNFSNCNKLFRKSIIDDHQLRYKKLKHAEDGLFLYEYLKECGLITGCPRYVYEYNKRLSIDAKSALKSLDGSMFRDAVTACAGIVDLTQDWSDEFREELNTRILGVTIIGEYYRRLWTLDDELFSELLTVAGHYRNLVGDERWKQICEANADLESEGHLRTKEDVVASPLISVVVTEGMDSEAYLNCLSTLYYQVCPNFEVMASSAYEAITPSGYTQRANFAFFEGDPLAAIKDLSKGQLVQIVREGCVYNENSLKLMAIKAMESSADFVSIRPMAYQSGQGMPLPPLDEVYSAGFLTKSQINEDFRASCNSVDILLSNKLFKREALVSLLYGLGKSSPDDLLEHSYRSLRCERLGNVIIGITTGIDEALYHPADEPKARGHKRKKKPVGKTVAQAVAARKGVYAVSSRLQPLNRKKVLFLSDTRTTPSGDYMQLKPVLEQRGYSVSEMYQSAKEPSGSRKMQAKLGYEMAIAGYIVLDGSYGLADFTVRRGQQLIQLCYALGAHERGACGPAGSNDDAPAPSSRNKPTKVIVGSDAIRKEYADTHGVDIDKVHVTGIPRADSFFGIERLGDIRHAHESKYPLLRDKKIVLIAPTDRRIPTGKMAEYIERFGLPRLHELLGDEYVFITKWHPAVQKRLKKMAKTPSQQEKWQRIRNAFEDMDSYVLDLSEEGNINDLLLCCDVLVTDYSSILFEYALLNKPIVFFWRDLNAYILDCGANCDMDEYVYGRVAYRIDDLAEAIAAGDLCEDRRALFVEKFMSECDGHSSERAVEWLLSPS